MSKAYAAVLITILAATCAVELVCANFVEEANAQRQVYQMDTRPCTYDNVMVGAARLRAEIGFMHMDLGQLEYYLQHNVSYQPDIYEYQAWKLPSLFVKEKGGDCEDYVLFALAVLDHSQYQLTPMVGTFMGQGHAWLVINGTQLLSCDILQPLENGQLPPEYHADQVYNDMLQGGDWL